MNKLNAEKAKELGRKRREIVCTSQEFEYIKYMIACRRHDSQKQAKISGGS